MVVPRFYKRLCILVLISLASTVLLHAQNTTGEIDGTVTDSTGAVVPGVVVTFTRVDTKEIVRTVKTNSKGEYSAPQLEIGIYTISVATAGFQKLDIKKIELNVGDTLTEDAKLQAGADDTTITVDATQVAPDVETATQGTTIGETEVKELALNTRNFEQLVLLQPGVSYTGDDENYSGQVTATGAVNLALISVNGLRNTQLSWSLDGADNLNEENSAQVAVFPSIDSIAETKTLRNSYGAQYGGGGSAQVITVTKAGTTAFHGDAYYFNRNQYLNANTFANLISTPQVARQPTSQNIFGYSIGGPLFIPKLYPRDHSHTFFFFSQEMRYITLYPGLSIGVQPRLQNLAGYFAYLCTNGAVPCTTCVANTKNDGTSSDAGYPCHLQGTESPAAAAYIKDVMMPETLLNPPNNPNQPLQGLIESERSTTYQNQQAVRFDHQFSQRFQAFARFIFDPTSQHVPFGYKRGVGFPGVGNSTIYSYGENFVVHGTFEASSSMVLDFGYSYLPYSIVATPAGSVNESVSKDVESAFRLPYPNQTGRIPNIQINQGAVWGTNGPNNDRNHTQQAFLNVTKQHGRQTWYFGANYEHFYSRINQGTVNSGTFTFTGNFPASFAKFLLGKADTFTQASIDPIAYIHQNLTEAYFQDNWRATPHFTANLGVRYTVYAQPYDGENHLGGLLPSAFNSKYAPTFGTDGTLCVAGVVNTACSGVAPNPAYIPNNGIISGGVNSPYGRAISRNSYLDFAPRVGFAWDVSGNGTTSLRAGFGIFYNHSPLTLSEAAVYGNPAYVQTISAGGVQMDAPAVNSSTTPLNISGQDPNWTVPYTESYSLDVQQQLAPNWLLDIAYVGNKTFHLQGEEDLNQPLPGEYAALGLNGGNAPVNATQDATYINAITPYPGWGPINFYSTRYFGDYNGLQVQMVKRFSKRSIISLNYTWSKSLANSTGESGAAPANRYDLRGEWGPTSTDRRQIFTGDVIYDLPFFEHGHGFVAHTLAGWEVSSIVILRTGVPLTAQGTNQDPAGQNILLPGSDVPDRPDQIGDPNIGAKNALANSFFNTAAFLQVLPFGTYRPGNARVGSINGPNYANVTFDLFRNINITSKVRLQFRAEAFNFFNHVNFNAVGTSINNDANFGTVTSAYDNRQLQLGAKMYF
jgi:hypothetical protein